jgi:hypothetical protein
MNTFFHNNGKDEDGKLLLEAIKDRGCVPFLGAGASYPRLPLGSELAAKIAEWSNYPFDDPTNLSQVAEWAEVMKGSRWRLRDFVVRCIADSKSPTRQNDAPEEVHRVLASIRQPLYVTTNYDDLMFKALESAGQRPQRETSRWRGRAAPLWRANHAGAVHGALSEPLVFHLHGHHETPESMVLSKKDYLYFLDTMSREPEFLPDTVTEHLKKGHILFIGYALNDLNTSLLLRWLRSAYESKYFIVLKKPSAPKAAQKMLYYERLFGSDDFAIFWGTASDFAAQLEKRL